MRFLLRAASAGLLFLSLTPRVWSASGSEGASFLEIPVGAEPAAVGSAYTAQASNAYAPVWNPAGLGRVDALEATATHLSYLQSVNYEFVGAAFPLFGSHTGEEENAGLAGGLGVSIQYLGSGNIPSYNDQMVQTGNYSSHFAAYSVAYGQTVTDRLALGVTGKAIEEKISDVSASAFANDFGVLYQAADTLSLGAALANVGTSIKFVDEADPLPLAARLGLAWRVWPDFTFSAEGVDPKNGSFSGHFGTEWTYEDIFSARLGYNTAYTHNLSGSAGFSGGIGLFILGQQFAYAYVPYGELGGTHYFTISLRFSKHSSSPRLKSVERPKVRGNPGTVESESNYDTVYQVLSDEENKALRRSEGSKNSGASR